MLVSHSETTRATPAEVWGWYADPGRWSRWDGGVREAHLDGPFATGTRGTIVLPNGRASAVRLLDVDPERAYTDRVRLRGITVTTTHRLEVDGPFTRITHEVRLGGLFGRLFPRLVAIPVRGAVPASVAQLAFLAARDRSDLPRA